MSGDAVLVADEPSAVRPSVQSGGEWIWSLGPFSFVMRQAKSLMSFSSQPQPMPEQKRDTHPDQKVLRQVAKRSSAVFFVSRRNALQYQSDINGDFPVRLFAEESYYPVFSIDQHAALAP